MTLQRILAGVSKYTNFASLVSIGRNHVTIDVPKPPKNPPAESRFFQKVDLLSFGLTTLVTLAVYLLTLAPEVTLDFSGVWTRI